MAYECKLIETYPGFGPELVTDGDMEDAPTTNWTAGGGAAIAANTVTVRNGCQSLRVTDGGAGGGYAYQNVTVEPGHKYKIDTWGYSSAAGDTWRVRVYIAGTVRWTGDTHDVLAPVAWEKDTKFYRIPDTVTTIQIRLEVVGAAKVVYFDDVSIRRETPVPMTEIDLQYNVGAGYSLLDRGIAPSRPERVSLYGGRLELELVRQEDGKRAIPLKLIVEGTTGQNLIDQVNDLEEMLRHAARYRYGGWGGEVFLSLKIDDATEDVWFPVLEGEIDTDRLYSKCGGEPQDMISELPVWLNCKPYWVSPYSYDLSNLLDNPGFEEWNNGICNSQPDGWTDYQTAGAAGRNDQETGIVEEGCEALQIELIAAGAGLYQGVTQNIGARVRADTEYTLLAWVQNEALTNGKVYIFVEGAGAAVRGTALNDGLARTDYTLVSCQFTPLPADVPANVHVRMRIEAVGGACTGVAHIDKMLVMEASNVPIAWKSSDYIVNCYDRTAGNINFTSVCDVPGETGAEARIHFVATDPCDQIRIAKRTRDEPCAFIWELLGVDAVVTAGDANCKDSALAPDGNAPGGQRVDVSFAGTQTYDLRCYWQIASDLPSYYGKFVVALLARASASTDIIKVGIKAYQDMTQWRHGGDIKITALTSAGAAFWNYMDGWELFAFPVGTHDNDLWGTGNQWVIEVWASITGAAAWDNLQIAGAYLVPVDEKGYLVAGAAGTFGAGFTFDAQDLDGDRGVFPYSPTTDRYYPDIGSVGRFPTLTPEIENWLYFSWGSQIVITGAMAVSVKYRPRGIFLRGTNP